MNKIHKNIIRLLLCLEYFDYCKQIKKAILFEHEGRLINTREAEKILMSFKEVGDQNRKKGWEKFIRKFAGFVLEDKGFEEWKEDMFTRCPECGYVPMREEKCSKHHPFWKEVQEHNKKFLGKDYDGVLNAAYKQKCSMCNHEEFYSTGIDPNPEKGIM